MAEKAKLYENNDFCGEILGMCIVVYQTIHIFKDLENNIFISLDFVLRPVVLLLTEDGYNYWLQSVICVCMFQIITMLNN